MGSVVKKVGQATGLIADSGAGAGAYGESSALMRRAMEELEKLGVPSIEAQKIAMQLPEVVGKLEAEQLGPSALENIVEDPELRQTLVDAMQAERQAAETGFSDEDRARLDAMRRATQADEQARQSSILQSMAERGALGSGSELAAKLASGQATADRAQQEALNLAAQGAQQRRAALANMSSMASGLRSQDLAKASQAASAKDAIAQFNAMQRSQAQAQNLAEQQRIAEQRGALQNQQQMYNKALIQQDYQNRLQKATGQVGATQSMAQQQMKVGQAQAGAAQAEAAGMRGLLGAGISAFGAADGGVKYAEGGVKEEKKKTLAEMIGFGKSASEIRKEKEAKPEERKKYRTIGGYEYADGGLSKEKVQAMIDALEAVKQGPNQIVANPYTETPNEEIMRSIASQPQIMDTEMPAMPVDLGAQYADGGVDAPSSYAEGGQRIDELVDAGELQVNPEAQEELMQYLRGNIESEDMDGRIIEGDNFSGDQLPDRINSGEMVVNLGQQERMKEDLENKDAELEGYRKLVRLLGKM